MAVTVETFQPFRDAFLSVGLTPASFTPEHVQAYEIPAEEDYELYVNQPMKHLVSVLSEQSHEYFRKALSRQAGMQKGPFLEETVRNRISDVVSARDCLVRAFTKNEEYDGYRCKNGKGVLIKRQRNNAMVSQYDDLLLSLGMPVIVEVKSGTVNENDFTPKKIRNRMLPLMKLFDSERVGYIIFTTQNVYNRLNLDEGFLKAFKDRRGIVAPLPLVSTKDASGNLGLDIPLQGML